MLLAVEFYFKNKPLVSVQFWMNSYAQYQHCKAISMHVISTIILFQKINSLFPHQNVKWPIVMNIW